MDFSRKDIILEKLLNLDKQLEQYGARKKLKSPLSMILIGGAGLIVKYGLARATRDIDILEPHQVRLNGLTAIGHLLAQQGFHIVSEMLLTLHPDYENRLREVAVFTNMAVFTLSPCDYAISKLGRGTSKDLDDILHSNLLDEIDIITLEKLYEEACTYWIGDETRFRANWDQFRRRVEETFRQKT